MRRERVEREGKGTWAVGTVFPHGQNSLVGVLRHLLSSKPFFAGLVVPYVSSSFLLVCRGWMGKVVVLSELVSMKLDV